MFEKIQDFTLNWLEMLGVSDSSAHSIFYLFVGLTIFLFSLLLLWLFRMAFKRVGYKLSKKTTNTWDDELYKGCFFTRLSYFIPLLVFDKSFNVFTQHYELQVGFAHVLINLAYVLWFSAIIYTLLTTWNIIFDRRYAETGRSINNIVQALKVILIIITSIVVISLLFNKSTSIILKSVGALSAVLMLVFKDTILGFVGGIQLAFNKIVLIGDWIEMPQYGADGTVIEISLITVKVQNWDKTITTIPTYSLVTNSVKNWRSASESGTRRIVRTINIDMTTVKFCDDALMQRLEKVEGISTYIKEKKIEIEQSNKEKGIDNNVAINGRRQTNLGIFRAYILHYLMNNPNIDKNSTLLVRQKQSTNLGIPMEIYVFTSTSAWLPYEDIQSDIFDHILASIEFFDLRIFQSPTGADLGKM